MDEIEQIQGAIERLMPDERAALAVWLRDEFGIPDSAVAEPPAPAYVKRKPARMSVEEYLALEDSSGVRYEYVAGEIFAMSGGTGRHGMIIQNLCLAFGNHLVGKPCTVFSSGMKVRLRVDRDDIFYCPDVMVICGKINQDSQYFTNPRLVVEVLSPSTEFTDRREKSLHYRYATALEEYVLVSQRTREVTIYRRADKWEPQMLGSAEDIVALRSISLDLPLEQIYAGISVSSNV